MISKIKEDMNKYLNEFKDNTNKHLNDIRYICIYDNTKNEFNKEIEILKKAS
jgi:hypothetical protein